MAQVQMGTIRERIDRPGKFEAAYYVNGKRRRVLANSREDAVQEVARLMEEARRKPETLESWNPKVTLSAYAETWLRESLRILRRRRAKATVSFSMLMLSRSESTRTASLGT
jgi:hypothetical protein